MRRYKLKAAFLRAMFMEIVVRRNKNMAGWFRQYGAEIMKDKNRESLLFVVDYERQHGII